ncbi:MAG TPA: response regulator [Candidatus Saccharimonadales bacterium]|nr:response regulator [Candidatus Saccharimonadales bacterium]
MRKTKVIGTVKPSQKKISDQDNVIVVADDDPAILDAMKMILESYNYKVETVSDGSVLPKLMTIKPKLLFLDIRMSGVNGKDVCRELKEIDETKDIPVVMISASCDLIKIVKEAGADDFLEKPFEMNDLLSKVNKYLLN